MISLSGLRPKYQAGNFFETTWLFPCLGGKKTIRRFISPRSTASILLHKSSKCAAGCHKPRPSYSINQARLLFASASQTWINCSSEKVPGKLSAAGILNDPLRNVILIPLRHLPLVLHSLQKGSVSFGNIF